MTKTEIADAEEISAGYVQQLMMALRLAGIVESHRGREGGFSLSRRRRDHIADVLKAVEGDVMPAPCQGGAPCDRGDDCPTRPVWEEAARTVERPVQQDHHRLTGRQTRRRSYRSCRACRKDRLAPGAWSPGRLRRTEPNSGNSASHR